MRRGLDKFDFLQCRIEAALAVEAFAPTGAARLGVAVVTSATP